MSSEKSNYEQLKRKFLQNLMWATLASIVVVIFLRYALATFIADWIIRILLDVFDFEYNTAYTIYNEVIKQNILVIVFIVFIILFYLFNKFLIVWFVRYFTEIDLGIQKILGEKDEKITLSTELLYLEQQLNTIKMEVKMKEKEAQLAEERKNELVMYLAHDLKTPLTTVIGYLNLLDETPELPIKQKIKYIGITLKKAERLEYLVDEFFEITRFNLQQIVLKKTPVNITVMLEQLLEEFYLELEKKQLVSYFETKKEVIIYADGDKLARVLHNILKNAILYSYEKTVIKCIVEHTDTAVNISVTNVGRILSEEERINIFERFYRLDSARATTGGAGLGLAISKKIIEAHQGSIIAISNKEGTTFKIDLPKG